MYDENTLQQKIQEARSRKVPEDVIQARVAEIRSQQTKPVTAEVPAQPSNFVGSSLPTQEIDPESQVRGSLLSTVGNGAISIGKAIGKGFAQAPTRLGQGLGEGINLATGGNQRNQDEVNAALEIVNTTSQQAVDAMRAGNTEVANKLFALAKKQNERARQLSESKTKELVGVEKDIAKGGAGTAAFFVPGGSTAAGAFTTGAIGGAASGYGASDDTNELSSTVGGGLLGGTASLAMYGLAKYFSPKKLGEKIVEKGDQARALGQTPVRTGNDVYAPSRDAAIEETLKNNKIRGTSAERFAQLQPKITELGDEARSIIEANPKPVEYKQVEKGLMENLAPNMRSKGIDAATAKDELQGYISDLVNSQGDDELRAAMAATSTDSRPVHQKLLEEAANAGDFKKVGRILDLIPEEDAAKSSMESLFRKRVPGDYNIPTELNTSQIDDLRKMVNEDYVGVRNQLKRGTVPLNARQTVIAGLKDTFDNIIKENHPEARDLVIQQSQLYNAAPSLAKGRTNPPVLRAFGTSIPRPVTEQAANIAGNVISAPGKVLQSLPEISPELASYLGRRVPLMLNGGGGEANQTPSTLPPISGGMTTDGVPLNGTAQSTNNSLPEIPSSQSTYTGHTVEEHAKALTQAIVAGDKEAENKIRKLYEMELAHAKEQGATGKPKSAAALQVLEKAKAGTAAIDTLRNEIKNNPQIVIQAKIPGSPGARIYSAALASLTDAIGGLRTGATVSSSQKKFYDQMTPQVGDSAETLLYKFQALQNELNTVQQGADTVEDPLTTGQLPPIGN